MATIRTAIQLQDGMSSVVRSMNTALNICINSFESMQAASSRAVDTASLQTARAELAKASIAMDHVEKNIFEAGAAQKQLNNEFRQGQSAADGLVGKVKNIAIGIATAVGANKIVGLSDTVTQTTARLDLMNDGMQTTAQLQEMIFASAERSRGQYLGTAAAVAQLGSQAKGAFASNAELIAFSEQLNKNFIIAGTNQQGVAAATLQLTQGMASGVLRGEELNSVFENAQPIIQHIADYLKVDVGQIRAMAQEGEITASIVKNALLAAANETNAKFETMPKTFDQIWTSVSNHGVRAFQPVLKMINGVANSTRFESMVNNVIGGMYALSNEIQYIGNQSAQVVNFIANNWEIVGPVVWGLVGAYGAYKSAVIGIAIVEGVSNAIKLAGALASYAQAAALGAQVSATATATAAQWGLNTAILACPVTWIIGGIILIIGVIYLAVAAYNKFAGTSISATGIIVGAFYAMGRNIMNVIAFVANGWISFGEFFINVFNHPLYSVKRLFVNWGNNILDIIGTIASAIDKVFKTGTTSAVTSLRNQLSGWIGKQPEGYKVLAKMEMTKLDDAYRKGYAIGENFGNKFNLGGLGNPGKGAGDDLFNPKVAANIADTAANTGKMKDSLDISSEDLKYLRDIAEQEVINRFTTAEINVAVSSQNNVSSSMDLDGMTTYLKDGLVEAVQTAAEKVHK